MPTATYSENWNIVAAHMRSRLGLELKEFFTPEELVEQWLGPGLAEGRTAAQVAEEIAQHFHYKYDLTWMDAGPYGTVPKPAGRDS